MLEQKRALASKVVGAGEQWITELDSGQLRELFALSEGAVADGDEEEVSAPSKSPTKTRRPSEVRP